MQRVRPATPAVFFLGVALICGSIMELARWPLLHRYIDSGDYEMTPAAWDEAVLGPDLEQVAAVIPPVPKFPPLWPDAQQLEDAVRAVLGCAAGLAALSLALVAMRRRRVGAALLMGAGVLALAGPALVTALQGQARPAWDEGMWRGPNDLVEAVVAAAGAVGLAGIVFVALRRRLVGAGLLVLGGLTGLSILVLAGLQVRVMGGFGTCSGGPSIDGETLVLMLQGYSVTMGLAVGAAWLLAQRQAGVVITPSTLLAAGLALAMIGVACVDAQHIVAWEGRWPGPPAPLWHVGLLLAAGLGLSALRPLYCSRAVSALLLGAGLLATVPAIAVEHDAALDLHPQGLVSGWPGTPLAMASCSERLWAPMALIGEDDLSLSGAHFERGRDPQEVEAALTANLREMREKFIDLHRAAGDADTAHFWWVNLTVDQKAPLSSVQAVAAAHRAVGGRFLDVIAPSHRAERLWTRPAFHVHACALRLELADDGQPMAAFGDWPTLLRAADRPGPPLRIRPR